MEDTTIEHEVDVDQIRKITQNTSYNNQMLRTDLLSDASADRDVAPGVNAPLLQVKNNCKLKIYVN